MRVLSILHFIVAYRAPSFIRPRNTHPKVHSQPFRFIFIPTDYTRSARNMSAGFTGSVVLQQNSTGVRTTNQYPTPSSSTNPTLKNTALLAFRILHLHSTRHPRVLRQRHSPRIRHDMPDRHPDLSEPGQLEWAWRCHVQPPVFDRVAVPRSRSWVARVGFLGA